MLVLRIQFPGGRYLTEGNESWPPSPALLARELILSCMRELPVIQGNRLERAIDLLSGSIRYALPRVVSDPLGRYIEIENRLPLFMVFNSEPSREELFDLKQLLCFTRTVGSNPVWIDAEISSHPAMVINCSPSDEIEGGTVRIDEIRPRCQYSEIRKRFKFDLDWIESIIAPRNSQPALIETHYSVAPGLMGAPGRNTNAIFRVVSDNPPPVTEALSIAETARKKLMGISRALLNEGNRVSPTFSGKNTDGSPMEGHLHAFIISYSSSSGKYIDTLVIRSDNGFGTHEVSCILHLNTLLIPSLGEVEFELEALLSEPPAVSKIWVSATPFITARHHRTSRGEWRSWMENEMQNELRLHGMDTPERVTAINSCSARNLSDFKRTRKNGIMNNFAAFRLEFSKPQKGPFSIGALCHFGLGTFIPEE